MTKHEWTKTRHGTWRHVSGWTVHHCGHPTANWPYYGSPPGIGARCPQAKMLLHGGIGLGYAFARLVLAQDAVEKIARKPTKGSV